MRTRVIAGLVTVAFAVVACGEDDTGGSGATNAGSAEIAVASGSALGTVVVDADGMTLYTTEREADGAVQCLDGCRGWPPALVSAADPAVAPELADRVGTVERPDGGLQATLDGMPLYRFSEDGAAGETRGEGIEDAFGGSGFEWHAVVVVGGRRPRTTTTIGGSYGGY